jgi:hypothetical protein
MSKPTLKKNSPVARIVAAIASVTVTASILAGIGALAEPPVEAPVLAQAAIGPVTR